MCLLRLVAILILLALVSSCWSTRLRPGQVVTDPGRGEIRVFVYRVGDSYGVISSLGRVIAKPRFSTANSCHGVWALTSSRESGILVFRERVTPFQTGLLDGHLVDAQYLGDGWIRVTKFIDDGSLAFYVCGTNTVPDLVATRQYDNVGASFGNGRLSVSTGDTWMVVNGDLEEVYRSEERRVGVFVGNHARYSDLRTGLYGYVDSGFHIVREANYELAGSPAGSSRTFSFAKINGELRLLDENFRPGPILHLSGYRPPVDGSAGFPAQEPDKGMWGIIDDLGAWRVPAKYDWVSYALSDDESALVYDGEVVSRARFDGSSEVMVRTKDAVLEYDFGGSVVAVSVGRLWCFFDREGTLVYSVRVSG